MTKYKVYKSRISRNSHDVETERRYWTGKYAEAPKRTITYLEYRRTFNRYSSSSDR